MSGTSYLTVGKARSPAGWEFGGFGWCLADPTGENVWLGFSQNATTAHTYAS